MNNHGYGYGDMEPGFHINIPKNNRSLPEAFQDDTDVASGFSETNFQNPVEQYFQDHASHPAGKEQNGNMFVNPSHHLQEGQGINQTAIYNSGIDNNAFENIHCNQDNPDQSSQPYCPDIGNQMPPMSFPESHQSPLETAFDSNVAPNQTFPSQYLPEQFANPNMFQPTAGADTIVQQSENVTNILCPTDFLGSRNTDVYYPVNVNSDVGRNMFTSHSDNLNVASSYSEPLLQTENVYPEADLTRNSSSSFGCHSPTMQTVIDSTEHCESMNSTQMPLPETDMPLVHNTGIMPTEDFHHSEAMPLQTPDQDKVSAAPSQEPKLSSDKTTDDFNQLGASDETTDDLNQLGVTDKTMDDFNQLGSLDETTDDFKQIAATENKVSPETAPSVELSSTLNQNLEKIDPAPDIKADIPENVCSGVDSTLESKSTHLVSVGNDTDNKVMKDPSTISEEKETHLSGEGVNPVALDETLECITTSLEEGIEASKENEENSSMDNLRPLSPMITLMDGDFAEGIETISQNTDKGSGKKLNFDENTENVRITRARTGTPRNKTPRFIEEFGDSDDSSKHSVQLDEWEYEDGAELAPCKPDPTVTVNPDVLMVTEEELEFYKEMFQANGVESILNLRLHCTSCGRHIGAAPNYIHLGNRHKVLRVLTCNRCSTFYGIGQFTKDSDGSELYCRWCGQGGQVICCSGCPNVFCQPCIRRNFGAQKLNEITAMNDWGCFLCNYKTLWPLRAICWALLSYTMKEKKSALTCNDFKKLQGLEEDRSKCCGKKQRRRKQPAKPRTSSNRISHNVVNNNTQEFDSSNAEAIDFGEHFLFGGTNLENFQENETEQNCQENPSEEDDYVDVSQFVQSVLVEKSPVQTRNASAPSPAKPAPERSSLSTAARKIQPRHQAGGQTRKATNTVTQQIMTSVGPRIVVRQENLLQPGLTPINFQPNRMVVPSQTAGVSRATLPGNIHGQTQMGKNSTNYVNNMDGVRSMDQLQSLNQVPWFRDGIDSIRAVGFALNKRIRDLEARFHSLKNKQDVEKVMVLGKKLNRLTSATDRRFKQITLTMQAEWRKWAAKNGSQPFNTYNEAESDWNDERELSKPLEKVMIPVSVAALQNAGIRPSGLVFRQSGPPPLVRTGAPLSTLRPRVPNILSRSVRPSFVRGQMPPIRTVLNVTPRGMPGPRPRLPVKNPAFNSRHINTNIVQTIPIQDLARVGAFINQRNGPNFVSISLTPSKRPREDSSSDDDIQVCPTEPELLKKYRVKPCRVRLEKCDEFIVSFLENQEQIRNINVGTSSLLENQEQNMNSNEDTSSLLDNQEQNMNSNEGTSSLLENQEQNMNSNEGSSSLLENQEQNENNIEGTLSGTPPFSEADVEAALLASTFVSCGDENFGFTETNSAVQDESDDDIEIISEVKTS